MRERPLAIDLFCGLGGWTEGLLAEGYDVVGFDVERHHYGEAKYPAQLVIQDVLTLHGSQFKTAALIVASPPCQAYSYMAMPWTRGKVMASEYRNGTRDVKDLTALFDACFRIQREAIAAAGHHIPLVVENVRGAQPWVGRSRWNYGSFHLWGDVPALMPIVNRRTPFKGGDRNIGRSTGGHQWDTEFKSGGNFHRDGSGIWNRGEQIGEGTKVGGIDFNGYGQPGDKAVAFNGTAEARLRCHLKNPAEHEGIKQRGSGREWFAGEGKISRLTSSKSRAHKAASATIAKIPFTLAQHIARAWKPEERS